MESCNKITEINTVSELCDLHSSEAETFFTILIFLLIIVLGLNKFILQFIIVFVNISFRSTLFLCVCDILILHIRLDVLRCIYMVNVVNVMIIIIVNAVRI